MITEPNFHQHGVPVVDRYIRKAVSYAGKILVVSDYLGEILQIGAIVDASAGRQTIAKGVPTYVWAHHAPESRIRCVVHIDTRYVTRDDFEKALFASPPPAPAPKVILLQVSSVDGGVIEENEIRGDFVWLSMKSRAAYNKVADWLPQFLDLSFEDAVKIVNAPDRAALDPGFQRKHAQLLDITHPGDPTARLGFRLLCEAWLMNNGKPTTCAGIPITPPGSLDDWLSPFKLGNITPDKVAVATMMGKTLEAQATAVLDAVGQGDALSISTAATTFVTACSQFLSTAGGAV